ncbi:trafficking protein particle complex subunit 11-like [Nasonia vitripennis]|uniref:Uncharacterized protein n=1 Tax=Nasonia vitripennis TaxID=7425 RepID=A0A7M7T6D9_NASVI|nr:trafficking protein particle complex subunit 11-like [Nasonia vitripennis]
MVATERATALCAVCELPAKTLYFLPYADHLLGYTFRLEHILYNLAQSFYHQEYRIVKSHREQLNKTGHRYLFARHQFKMAFLKIETIYCKPNLMSKLCSINYKLYAGQNFSMSKISSYFKIKYV